MNTFNYKATFTDAEGNTAEETFEERTDYRAKAKALADYGQGDYIKVVLEREYGGNWSKVMNQEVRSDDKITPRVKQGKKPKRFNEEPDEIVNREVGKGSKKEKKEPEVVIEEPVPFEAEAAVIEEPQEKVVQEEVVQEEPIKEARANKRKKNKR